MKPVGYFYHPEQNPEILYFMTFEQWEATNPVALRRVIKGVAYIEENT